MLRDRFDRVRQRIQRACQRSGRDPSCVTLLCVTKGVASDLIRQAVSLGAGHVGENRVPEAMRKRHELGKLSVRWHLIGHLQRNKAAHAVELFDAIHSVDSLALVQALERLAAESPRRIDVFIQINISGEATKTGCRPQEAHTLVEAVAASGHLRLAGLMTMAPFSTDPEGARPVFRHLRRLADELQTSLRLSQRLQLSMGMSQDFEVAIEEGADIVRIGTAIFGQTIPR